VTHLATLALLLIVILAALAILAARQRASAQFFTHTPEIACVLDLSGRLIRVNPAWYVHLGGTPRTVTRQRLAELVHPDDVPALQQGLQTLAAGHPVTMDLRCRRVNGDYLDLLWRAQPVLKDSRVYATLHDRSEQARTEEGLRSMLRFRQTVGDSLACGIAVVDMCGRIIDTNRAFAEWAGQPPAALLGRQPPFADVSAENRQTFRCVLAGQAPRDGTLLPGGRGVRLLSTALQSPSAAQIGWVLCVIKDSQP
jgi:PAS domain S-box-containing protein